MPARGTATGRQNAVGRQTASGRLSASNRQYVSGGGGAVDDMTLLDAQVVSAATAANITFSAISGAYSQLIIFLVLRGDHTSATNVLVRFNGDSGANYDWQALSGNNVTASANVAVGATSMVLGRCLGTDAPAGSFGVGTITIPFYSSTTQDKGCVAISGSSSSNLAGGQFSQQFYGNWYTANAAITSIVLFPSTANFVQNSRASLYGIT